MTAAAVPYYDKPLAAHGLKSYRYKIGRSFVMIGAKDNAGALREAKRSLSRSHGEPTLENLEQWNGKEYAPASAEAPAAVTLPRLNKIVRFWFEQYKLEGEHVRSAFYHAISRAFESGDISAKTLAKLEKILPTLPSA